jgi:hypothetical protein
MELKDILAIAGRPGLWRIINTTRKAIVVESLANDQRIAIPSTQRVSSLGEISIFTYEEDIPLGEVLNMIYEKNDGGKAPHSKEPHETLRAFVTAALTEMDQERVYHSDLKKLCTWYNAMLEMGVLPIADDSADSDSADEVIESADIEVVEESKEEDAK